MADQKRVTAEDIEAAFAVGFGVGIQDQKQRDDVKWEQFFADAKLKNTVTGEPIESLDDFLKWKAQFTEAQKRPKVASDQPSPPRETVYLMEDKDGFLTRVPESKLEAWKKAQVEPPKPLTEAERKLKDMIMQRVYGDKEAAQHD